MEVRILSGILANERFSGRGHSRHICRECSRFGKAELDDWQFVRKLEGCCTWEGFEPRKRRHFVRRHLNHDDLRIRAYAEELLTGAPVGDHVVELSREEYEALGVDQDEGLIPLEAILGEDLKDVCERMWALPEDHPFAVSADDSL